MADDHAHSACVNAWMDRATRGLPPERVLRAFEQGFAVLWQRACQTLGDVTLTAIMDRVLYIAVEQFPLLASVEIQTAGIKCEDLVANASRLDRDLLAEGIRFVMTQFLTILGNLTSEILTPALHGELSKVGPSELGAPDRRGEDTQS